MAPHNPLLLPKVLSPEAVLHPSQKVALHNHTRAQSRSRDHPACTLHWQVVKLEVAVPLVRASDRPGRYSRRGALCRLVGTTGLWLALALNHPKSYPIIQAKHLQGRMVKSAEECTSPFALHTYNY